MLFVGLCLDCSKEFSLYIGEITVVKDIFFTTLVPILFFCHQ